MSDSEQVIRPCPDDGCREHKNDIHADQSDQTPSIAWVFKFGSNGTESDELIDCHNQYAKRVDEIKSVRTPANSVNVDCKDN